MLSRLYAKWMFAWETALTTRDTNRVVRPLEWGFDWLPDETADSAQVDTDDFQTTVEINRKIVADSDRFFGYATPVDFRLETRHPQLFPTNVRPETLAQDAELRSQAAAGQLEEAQFLRFTSPVRTRYPENDIVNARWYPAPAIKEKDQQNDKPAQQKDKPAQQKEEPAQQKDKPAQQKDKPAQQKDKPAKQENRPRQAIIVMPQWNADAFSHNALCTIFNRFGIAALRLSKPYHDIRRPAEIERSDYAVSANVGRTTAACRQAVVDIRSCLDWLETQGYEQFGVLGTSLGSCYAFIAAAHDPRLKVCAFNHASTWFGDVVWTGQSTRHVRAAFEQAGLSHDQVREIFTAVSPMAYMERFAANPKRVLVVHATYDLTFLREFSLDVLRNFDRLKVDYVSKVLPCGHYTTGETPYKYIDGWYLGSFIYNAFKRLRT